jgi:non-reducing end alpha-L-arabinofuranosidase
MDLGAYCVNGVTRDNRYYFGASPKWKGFPGLVGLLLAVANVGCADEPSPDDDTDALAGEPSAGSPTAAAPSPGPLESQPSGGPTSTPTPTSTAVDLSGSMECTNVAPCGGEVVGTWNVTSSCLDLAGDMDVRLTSLGCATVPVTGALQTTGTFVVNADGTYADNTTTTGQISFPLVSSCLSISGVEVTCDRVGAIFTGVGWKTTACAETNGTCACELSTVQQGGLGAILPYTERNGQYSTSGSTLTASNATYSYCTSGDTLTLTPQASALTGNVVLQKEGTVAPPAAGGMGAGGETGAAGGASGGDGGMMSGGGEGGTMSGGGEGGMMSGEGGMMSGEGGMTAGGAGGAMSGEGGEGGEGTVNPLGERPCDIYAAAGTECVAAHSTVRALFAAYTGNLYQVKRADGMTLDITVGDGGFADSAQQDSFCGGTSCTIWRVYDQTGNDNFLEAQTPDSTFGGNNGQTAANAAAESLTVGGHQVYSLFTRPSQAYWNDGSENGMPLGADPQGIYMVTSGEHFNSGCCYNYGNAQLNRMYSGGPMMDSVYFGNNTIWGTGAGDGPWVMADMEDGMLANGTPGAMNPNSMSLPFPYVTAMEKNDGTTNFALKGGDATQPTLSTMWDGPLPGSKTPMEKEGAVILGAGGDCCYSNNNLSEGTFYEGAIVTGYPSDETDEAVHRNIVETGYGQ